MNAPGRVVHTGQVVIDLTMRVDALPEPGGDVFGEDTGVHVGGGYNVLLAARRLAVETVYAGALGQGPWSRLAADELADIGVAHVGPTLDGDLGYCIAVTDAAAERTFLSTRGAETRAPIDSFDQLDLGPSDVLYVSGYSFAHDLNRAAVERLAGRLAAGGGAVPRVLVDATPVIGSAPDATIDALRPVAPIWSVNERELGLLARRYGVGADEPPVTARALADVLGSPVLARVGADGSWWAGTGEAPAHTPSIVVNPVDTNGAGDAHGGVLAAALARGADLATALRWANVAGALSTTRVGPATCPTEEEIRAAL